MQGGLEGERSGVEGVALGEKSGGCGRSAGWLVSDLVGNFGEGEEGVDRAAVGEGNGLPT